MKDKKNSEYIDKNKKFSQEEELFDFINMIYKGEVIRNTYDIIPPKELDIFIPQEKIAIELNGLYWHSNKWIKKYNHLDKLNNCLEKNIKLIQIFEDEWIFKKNIVKNNLRRILSKNKYIRLKYKNCKIIEIGNKKKSYFLEKFNIQGTDYSFVNIGVFYKNKLVAVMTFNYLNKLKHQWKISRFSIDFNYIIPGIFENILGYFKKKYLWEEIIYYVDRRWDFLKSFNDECFDSCKITNPNFWYISETRMRYRFSVGIGKDFMNLNESDEIKKKYLKIWDCGSLKFSIKNKEHNSE